jgi:hypothetical protein
MAAPISKQERIRLNQQRSRARKQEYLQDLEKRVLDCHTTCREADLQRESYHQLHTENLKLRSMLGSVGIGDAEIDAYIHNDASDPSAEQTPLRHLRPKLQAEPAPAQTSLLAPVDDVQGHTPPSHPHPGSTTVASSTSSNCCGSTCVSTGTEVEALTLTPSIIGLQQPQYCETLDTFFKPTSQSTPENSVLCSQARDLIDQYNMSGQDIQSISPRLATGFAPEINPGEGCRVNKRLLFEVLNDISSDLS